MFSSTVFAPLFVLTLGKLLRTDCTALHSTALSISFRILNLLFPLCRIVPLEQGEQ